MLDTQPHLSISHCQQTAESTRVAAQCERMTPTNATDAVAVFHRWNSPVPYLFGGLVLMLGLISVALLILACSFRRPASDSSTTQAGEKPAKEAETQPPMEPGFVVIMPGDDNPKYLAKPVASDRHVEQV